MGTQRILRSGSGGRKRRRKRSVGVGRPPSFYNIANLVRLPGGLGFCLALWMVCQDFGESRSGRSFDRKGVVTCRFWTCEIVVYLLVANGE